MSMIDLSTTIAPGPDLEITYRDHSNGAKTIETMFQVPSNLLRNGEGWAVEEFTRFSTHGSTHIDAPWHYNSEIEGQQSLRVDELPLEWFFNDGVVLEMRHKADGDSVTVDDVQEELERIGCTLKPLDIVLVRTGRDEFYGQPGPLPPFGFKVACFPLKIKGGSGAPARVVAILDE